MDGSVDFHAKWKSIFACFLLYAESRFKEKAWKLKWDYLARERGPVGGGKGAREDCNEYGVNMIKLYYMHVWK
jgi:hypothetical protein